MNTVNASTGFSGFQLKMGQSPQVILLLILLSKDATTEQTTAHEIMTHITLDVKEAQDNLLAAKIHRVHHANEHHTPEDIYEVGNLVMLSSKNYCCNYKHKEKTCVAKFMLQNNIPYTVTHAFLEHSEYTLKLLNNPNTFPSFHAHLPKMYIMNDPLLFPNCKPS